MGDRHHRAAHQVALAMTFAQGVLVGLLLWPAVALAGAALGAVLHEWQMRRAAL